MREYIRSNLAMAMTKLAACPSMHARSPDGGYYLFPAVDGWDDEEELVVHLLKHGVLVHPGYFYGYEHGTHLMISCLTQPDLLSEGLDRLIAALAR